jgi:trigger factor
VTKADYAEKVNNTLKDYQRKMHIDGFRKGKTPFGIIKKMYGKTVLVEELQKVLSHELLEFIKDQQLHILGDPILSEEQDKDLDKEEDYEFLYDIAYIPEMDTRLDEEDHIPFYTLRIDDEMIDQELSTILARGGELVSVEEVTDADLVKGKLVELDAGGTEKEEGLNVENASLLLSRITDETVLAAFAGATIGSRVVFNLPRACPNKTDLAAMLEVNKEEAEGITSDFALTIDDIRRYVPAQPTQEFFDKVYGEGVVNSVEECRERIREELRVQFLGYSHSRFRRDAREKILEKNKQVTLPEDFLKRWLVARGNKEALEILEKEPALYREEFIWHLLREKMVKEYQIQVTDEELKEIAISVASDHLQQLGVYRLSPGQLEDIVRRWLANEEKMRDFQMKGEDYKLFRYIKDKVTLDEQELPLEDFKALLENRK